MSLSLALPDSSVPQAGGRGTRLFIDPNSLILSADGDIIDSFAETSYGVPCLLHNNGAVETVLVSSLSCGQDVRCHDDVPEEMQHRVRALWQHPHRCITPPVGLSSCVTSSGSHCLLCIEQLRSTSSLQSMILSQMQCPERPLYSNKQAVDWLVQLASALAHLHSVSPEMPHGRLSASVIAVTSAVDISVGRCVTAAATHGDRSPSSKRLHVMYSTSQPNIEAEGEPLVPETFRPLRAGPSEWRSFSSLPNRRCSAGISAAFSSPEFSQPGQQLSFSDVSENSGSRGDGQGQEHSLHSTAARCSWSGTDRLQAWEPPVDESLQRLSLSGGKNRMTSAGVSSAQVPGVGVVFKVSLPSTGLSSSGQASLHDVAEAAVWSRTDSGVETKQHGGALFASSKLFGSVQSRSAPLPKQASSSSDEGAHTVLRSSAGFNATAPGRSLDAADTDHVLLRSPMMWDPSSHPDAAQLPRSTVLLDPIQTMQPHVLAGTVHAGASYTRVVPRHAARAPFVTPFRDVQRLTEDGAPAAAACRSPGSSTGAAKRSRSGLSQRLPSLVELPGAEARCAALDADSELDCSSVRDSLDGTHIQIQAHTSLPGPGVQPLDDSAAARPVHAGLSQFSSSSPGDQSYSQLARADHDEANGLQSGLMISHALSRLRNAAPALARVRATALRAVTGPPSKALPEAIAQVKKPSCKDTAMAGVALQDSIEHQRFRPSREQKQRGGLSVMQLLQHANDDARERWRNKLLSRRHSCAGRLQPSMDCNAANHIGRWHDDMPYLAPEVLEGGEASTAADCFSFGVIMYEVLMRELVAADIAMYADLNDISDSDALRWHVTRIVDGERPHVSVSWPAEVKEVIQLCWQDNPFDRPTLASVHASLASFQASSTMLTSENNAR